MAIVTPPDALGQASSALSSADSMIQSAMFQAQSTVDIPDSYIKFNPPSVSVDVGGGPGTFDGSFSIPPFNDSVSLESISVPGTPSLPPAPAPLDSSDLFNIDKPSFDIDDSHLTAPHIDTPDVPDAPDIANPTYQPPSTSGLEAPEVTAPGFDNTFEGKAPTPPQDLGKNFKADFADATPQMRAQLEAAADSFLTKYCPEYHNALSKLESKISDVMNGDTALDDTIEQQIWERAKSRILDEAFNNERQAAQGLAKRGFSVPPGVMQAALQEARTAATRALSSVASETAVERAKIELNHLEFCLNLTSQMRQSMMQAVTQTQSTMVSLVGQAISYAQQIGAFAVETFNAELQVFNARIALYQARADVYRVELEAAFADLEVFRAKLEAEQLKTEVDRNAIETYRARIEAEETKVRMYATRLQGVQTLSEIERSKLETFRAKVEAFSAKVRGKEAEFGAYQAAMEGDRSKVQVYGERIRAYESQIRAANTQLEGSRIRADVANQHNQNLVQQFQANVRKYQAELEAKGLKFSSDVDAYRAAIDAYRADIQAAIESGRLEMEGSQQQLDAAVSEAQMNNDKNIAVAKLEEMTNKLTAQIAMAGAEAYGDMAASAMSVISSIAVEEIQSG